MAGFANTSLSIVGILTYQNESMGDAVIGPLPEVIGISHDTLQKWLEPCEFIDNQILTILDNINSKKQEIVDICQLSISGGCGFSSTTTLVTSVYASVPNGTVATGIGTISGTSVGLGTSAIVAYGTVYEDTLLSLAYPNLENGDYNTDNPIENGSDVEVNSGNAGIGKENTFSQNSGTQLGYVFGITNTIGICAGYATSINNLIQDIASLRSGISTYISSSNLIKGYKHSQQLDYWSLNKISDNLESTINANNSILSILNNPSSGGPY